MDDKVLDSNLIEMMVEETLEASGKFIATYNQKSMAYEITLNGLHFEIPSNWSCLTSNTSGEVFFPKHLLEVLEPEVGLGTLESVSIVTAYDETLQLDVKVSNLLDLNVA